MRMRGPSACATHSSGTGAKGGLTKAPPSVGWGRRRTRRAGSCARLRVWVLGLHWYCPAHTVLHHGSCSASAVLLTVPLVLGRFRLSGLLCLPLGCFAALASTLAPPSLCSVYCQVNLVRCPVLVCVQGSAQRRLPPRPLQACAQVRHVAVAHLQLLLPRLLQLAARKASGDTLCIIWETSAGHTACDRVFPVHP